ncbi:MAG: tRNA epoxyqueuosine(34) reductase QueG [Planctomycetes bacterium]|nr:tRNA epoxyqueuosine(34) reductase QueG [Planctomycetota bacterium]
MSRSQLVLERALAAGFDLAGLTPLTAPHRAGEFRAWLAAGRHGAMEYLREFEPRITAPQVDLPWARTLLVVGLGHARSAIATADGARIARYAAGRDYHNVIGKRLKRLALGLKRDGLIRDFRKVVDAGPLLERAHAARAGLGFESKAANLLHPRFGPWFFLGELVLDVEFEPTPTPPTGSCGTCTACLEACPTHAIVAPGVVDARWCISYLTIEHPGPVPTELRPQLGNWVFGCDVCSEVCPWGHRAPDLAERFGTHAAVEGAGVLGWLKTGLRDPEALAGSPLQRAGPERLLRNTLLFFGNHPVEEARPVLLEHLERSPAPLLREAAGWALVRGHGRRPDVRLAVERAAGRDPDPEVRAELRGHLDRGPGPG